MDAQQPFLYGYAATSHDDFDNNRAPSKPFDPKAVTRASWEPKPQKPRHKGPLVSFNQHPDAHLVPEPRPQYKLLGPRTKHWIKGLRIVQLCLRVLELVAAAGILFLFIIINHVSSLTAWILRITAGVAMLHCAYGVFHLARPAAARPPASSAAYQTFASVTDLAVLPLYAYGCLTVHNSSADWGTLLKNQSLVRFFLPALFYALLVGAALHLISMMMGLWLALKFRQIARLPPDMNPLEDRFTARTHQKKVSGPETPSEGGRFYLEDLRRSGMPYDDPERPPSIPFHATRSSPRSSVGSADYPIGKYQIEPGNTSQESPRASPRNSVIAADLRRMSAPLSSSRSTIVPTPPPRNPWRRSQIYTEVTPNDLGEWRPPCGRTSYQAPPSPRGHGQHSRSSTAHPVRQHPTPANAPTSPSQPRPAKFTESWYASESLFNRTHAKNRNGAPPLSATQNQQRQQQQHQQQGDYEAIQRSYDVSDSESDYENETATAYSVLSPPATEVGLADSDNGFCAQPQLNPLRSHPSIIAGTKPTTTTSSVNVGTIPNQTRARPISSYISKSVLSEIDLNDGRVNGGKNDGGGAGGDAADTKKQKFAPSYGGLAKSLLGSSKRDTWIPRDRDSSVQSESHFFSKPYGDLRASTPPVIIGADRQVSSGNDYDTSAVGGGQAAKRYFSLGKRNVSSKVIDESRAVGYIH